MSIDNQTEGKFPIPQRAGDCKLPLSEEVCSNIVSAHGPMVKAACYRVLGNADLAEDAAQEVFLILVRKLPSLPAQTILGGWLYVTACQVAGTHLRTNTRRWQRENQPEVVQNLMNPAQDNLWRELEPLLDDAMLTLSERQRELVLSHYFQNINQRAAAGLIGCSESVVSRELAAAIENLRRYFSRQGVTVSAATLAILLMAHGAQASLSTAGVAAALSAASAFAGTSAAGTSVFLALMNTTTAKVIAAAAAALLITSGTVFYLTQENAQPTAGDDPASVFTGNVGSKPPPDNAGTQATITTLRPGKALPTTSVGAAKTKARPLYDEAALKAATEKFQKFHERLRELALMGDPLKVQQILSNEFGIRLSPDEIRKLQRGGEKGFIFGVSALWATKQPQEALAWGASVSTRPIGFGGDPHQFLIETARKALPNLNREMLDGMLPDGPSRAKMLDLVEAGTDPYSLANRILAMTDSAERSSRLRLLAQGWDNPTISSEWARQNLSGTDKTAFYAQVGYNLAEQNPQAALQVLGELKGTETYAPTFEAMMRGLVQTGGLGEQAAELIDGANLQADQRSKLISELSRRWVRSDPDATVAWVNTLTNPEDFRAAIPLLVSQLDNDRVSRTVKEYLSNGDPVMESALIEAAAPASLGFDPEKSRLILDPLVNKDPGFKLAAGEGNGASKEEKLWNAVNQTAKREAEVGQPAVAMQWLATLPFATQDDYARAVASVLSVWNLKSQKEAVGWVQNSALNPTLKADLLKSGQP